MAVQIARFHDVWVLTRESNRAAIENQIRQRPTPRIHWEFLDPSRIVSFWKRGSRGLLPFYYLWQLMAYRRAEELRKQVTFDLVHHVTLTQYWSPSYLALLGLPFVWGPLGGAERTPSGLMKSLSGRGRLMERRRQLLQAVGTADPFLRATGSHSSLALATTRQTAAKLEGLGCRRVERFGCFGLSNQDLDQLTRIPIRTEEPLRLVSLGRLLGWKGFHLGIAAFARVHKSLPGSEYWIVGDGPERSSLMQLAQISGVGAKVRFFGEQSHCEIPRRLSECDALVHPSFHDAGAMVCNEAMAAGRPVICLDQGGPGTQVGKENGFKIAATNSSKVIDEIAEAITWLGRNIDGRRQMGVAARRAAKADHSWDGKGEMLASWYEQLERQPLNASGFVKSAVG